MVMEKPLGLNSCQIHEKISANTANTARLLGHSLDQEGEVLNPTHCSSILTDFKPKYLDHASLFQCVESVAKSSLKKFLAYLLKKLIS